MYARYFNKKLKCLLVGFRYGEQEGEDGEERPDLAAPLSISQVPVHIGYRSPTKMPPTPFDMQHGQGPMA